MSYFSSLFKTYSIGSQVTFIVSALSHTLLLIPKARSDLNVLFFPMNLTLRKATFIPFFPLFTSYQEFTWQD